MAGLWMGSGWKMNLLTADVEAFCTELRHALLETSLSVNVFVVPSFPYLNMARELLAGTAVHIAAQNMHWEPAGAYTGEVSPAMLQDIGVSIVELGHHERRTLFHESDEQINCKVLAALMHGLRPLICVGESEPVNHDAATERIGAQVRAALQGVSPAQLAAVLLAYEPGWAIGTGGNPAAPDHVVEMHIAMRETITGLYDRRMAEAVPILYGGSVRAANAGAYLREPAVDGLFVGRAARRAADFMQLIQLAESLRGGEQSSSDEAASR